MKRQAEVPTQKSESSLACENRVQDHLFWCLSILRGNRPAAATPNQ
jgi:hypothetical protein